MANKIKLHNSEKQLSDLTRALLTSDFVDVIQDAVNNSNDHNDDIFWDRESEFYKTIQSKLENALFQCDIIEQVIDLTQKPNFINTIK